MNLILIDHSLYSSKIVTEDPTTCQTSSSRFSVAKHWPYKVSTKSARNGAMSYN